MDDKNKPEFDYTAGIKALSLPEKTEQRSTSSLLLIRFIFKCKQCGHVFLLEDLTKFRTALSMEDAQELLREFSKTLEPRTITCPSCRREAEYSQQDVGFASE